MSTNPLTCFDFNCAAESTTKDDLTNWLVENCKEWVFQKEQGEKTGYLHWQGRFKVKVRARLEKVAKMMKNIVGFRGHISVTSDENTGNNFYVTKSETRIEGPYKSDDEIIKHKLPRQVTEVLQHGWRPFQKHIISCKDQWDPRTINLVECTKGCTGKTILTLFATCEGWGRRIPYCNDYKEMLRMVCDMPLAKVYFFDMPRTIDVNKLRGFFTAIEDIKNGHIFDDRYKYREKIFDSPQVWVFCNKIEEEILERLSLDRWKCYELNSKYEIIPIVWEETPK